MTLDPLDQAFVDRWRTQSQPEPTRPPASDPETVPVVHAEPVCPPPADAPRPVHSDPILDPLALLLLEMAPAQWQALADEIEAARLAGHRVIAITGGESGEGRTTLVACLATVLRRRGRDVIVCDATDLATCVDGVLGGGQLHDKRIVLVDAGVWFPPGPVRRSRLVVASLGCDAAILVRRADREPAPAWATALAAVGVTVLGEVVTFARPPEEAVA